MTHIRLSLWDDQRFLFQGKSLWSRSDFVQMVQRVQKSGAVDLWSFVLQVVLPNRREGCQAMRVGWLDVPRQPTLRGEWQIDLLGASSEDTDMRRPTTDHWKEPYMGPWGSARFLSNMGGRH